MRVAHYKEKELRRCIINHNNRCCKTYQNEDVDLKKTKDNYTLTPYINIPREEQFARRKEIARLEYEHYKELKKQFFCFNREDVNTISTVIVTLPPEITDPETEEQFFRATADFLSNRYKNTVSITVHKDEGKHYSENGIEIEKGRSHLHYSFIPTVPIDHEALAKKKNPIKKMFAYDEKICAKECINKKDLQSLHPDMSAYITDVCGIKCTIYSGITKEQGGNKTVEELKRNTEKKLLKTYEKENAKLRKDLEQARDKINSLEHELTKLKEMNWEISWDDDITRDEEHLW